MCVGGGGGVYSKKESEKCDLEWSVGGPSFAAIAACGLSTIAE